MSELKIHDLFRQLEKTAIRVKHEKAEDPIPLGQSKYGGKPHLPEGVEWPRYTFEEKGKTEDKPLSFLAQFNLAETHPFDTDGLLPSTGMLYFFYEMESMKWGFDPKDRGCSRVFYVGDAAAQLTPMDFPEDLDAHYIIPEFNLSFKKQKSLPSFEEFEVHAGNEKILYEDAREQMEEDGEDLDEWDLYENALENYGCPIDEETNEDSRLLGYADVIQNEMLEECEKVSRGFYCGDAGKKLSGEERRQIKEQRKEWVLLFQMGTVADSEEEYELMWGDAGCIFFYIKKEDLKERNFEKTWLILQCY